MNDSLPRRLSRWVLLIILPNQRLRLTREGRSYSLVWFFLMFIGLYLQSNLVLLIAGLSAGPLVASVLLSSRMLRRLEIGRRVPAYAFAEQTLELDYILENHRRYLAALAMTIEDALTPVDRTGPNAVGVIPRVVFTRVPARDRGRQRWQGSAPVRGRYAFGPIEVITRSPFGLLERRLTLEHGGELIVYPRIGQLQRRWQHLYRDVSEAKRGRRHDRSAMEQEYHGLRDYRPGDTLRWIHWRTSARVGQPMVREFEQQNEQDLAILLDPWLPRSKVTPELREALEDAIRFVASLCYDTCRRSTRRLVLGWTGPAPGLCQGFASVKLLHELLAQLAVLRASAEGTLSGLIDTVPGPVLRDGQIVVVSTRAVNLTAEVARSTKLGGSSARSLSSRSIVLDAARGDLKDLVDYTAITADLQAPLPVRETQFRESFSAAPLSNWRGGNGV